MCSMYILDPITHLKHFSSLYNLTRAVDDKLPVENFDVAILANPQIRLLWNKRGLNCYSRFNPFFLTMHKKLLLMVRLLLFPVAI